MDFLTVLNTAVGLMSLVLGGFAIWLAFQMYSKAKDSETVTARTLEGIKAQSDALQRLTGRWMDRFTRHATEPRPADEGLLALVSTVAALPTTILSHLQAQPRIDASTLEAWVREAIDGYVAMYYYTSMANVLSQALLPPEEQFDISTEYHAGLKAIVDGSAADFALITNLLNRVDQNRLQASTLKHLLDEAVDRWRPLVKTTDQCFAQRRSDDS